MCKNNKKYPVNELISIFNTLHNNKYTYNFTEYNSQKDFITIKCNICFDSFNQRIYNHIHGNGCPNCGKNKRYSTEEVILQFQKIHGCAFNYDKVVYKNAKTKVLIKCNHCNTEFLKTPDKHKQGEGCKNCTLMYNSFKKNDWIKQAKNRKGTFYIIKCWNETENFIKLGITFVTIKKRYMGKERLPYKYEIIKKVVSDDLSYIWDLEKRFKRIKQKQHYTPLIPFKGSVTECFK